MDIVFEYKKVEFYSASHTIPPTVISKEEFLDLKRKRKNGAKIRTLAYKVFESEDKIKFQQFIGTREYKNIQKRTKPQESDNSTNEVPVINDDPFAFWDLDMANITEKVEKEITPSDQTIYVSSTGFEIKTITLDLKHNNIYTFTQTKNGKSKKRNIKTNTTAFQTFHYFLSDYEWNDIGFDVCDYLINRKLSGIISSQDLILFNPDLNKTNYSQFARIVLDWYLKSNHISCPLELLIFAIENHALNKAELKQHNNSVVELLSNKYEISYDALDYLIRTYSKEYNDLKSIILFFKFFGNVQHFFQFMDYHKHLEQKYKTKSFSHIKHSFIHNNCSWPSGLKIDFSEYLKDSMLNETFFTDLDNIPIYGIANDLLFVKNTFGIEYNGIIKVSDLNKLSDELSYLREPHFWVDQVYTRMDKYDANKTTYRHKRHNIEIRPIYRLADLNVRYEKRSVYQITSTLRYNSPINRLALGFYVDKKLDFVCVGSPQSGKIEKYTAYHATKSTIEVLNFDVATLKKVEPIFKYYAKNYQKFQNITLDGNKFNNFPILKTLIKKV